MNYKAVVAYSTLGLLLTGFVGSLTLSFFAHHYHTHHQIPITAVKKHTYTITHYIPNGGVVKYRAERTLCETNSFVSFIDLQGHYNSISGGAFEITED